MKLTRRQLAQLQIAVHAAVHGRLVRTTAHRENSIPTARMAKQHADDAVRAYTTNGKRVTR